MRLLLALPLLLATLGNADVVKLVKAGLSAETIEAKIVASETDFDTSTDALVALANDGVPDRIIKRMIERDGQPAVAQPATATPAPNLQPMANHQPPTKSSSALTRRYDVTVHADGGGKCEAELRIDGKGVKASRCKAQDFELAWTDIQNVCVVYGFRGELVLKTADRERRISTTTPVEAKRLAEHIRLNAPKLPVSECR